VDGIVQFKKSKLNRTWVSVVPMLNEVAETKAAVVKSTPAEAVVEAPVAAPTVEDTPVMDSTQQEEE
jgi:hypothetical protein